jgi:hypothetical protein
MTCGTCAHWHSYEWWSVPTQDMGGCLFPLPLLPLSLRNPTCTENMLAGEGEGCPVWRAREKGLDTDGA